MVHWRHEPVARFRGAPLHLGERRHIPAGALLVGGRRIDVPDADTPAIGNHVRAVTLRLAFIHQRTVKRRRRKPSRRLVTGGERLECEAVTEAHLLRGFAVVENPGGRVQRFGRPGGAGRQQFHHACDASGVAAAKGDVFRRAGIDAARFGAVSAIQLEDFGVHGSQPISLSASKRSLAMFAVAYRWKLIPGREAAFEEGWKAGTAAIAREFGGWGSRLHRGEDGCFYAYAQWPDRATWEKA